MLSWTVTWDSFISGSAAASDTIIIPPGTVVGDTIAGFVLANDETTVSVPDFETVNVGIFDGFSLTFWYRAYAGTEAGITVNRSGSKLAVAAQFERVPGPYLSMTVVDLTAETAPYEYVEEEPGLYLGASFANHQNSPLVDGPVPGDLESITDALVTEDEVSVICRLLTYAADDLGGYDVTHFSDLNSLSCIARALFAPSVTNGWSVMWGSI